LIAVPQAFDIGLAIELGQQAAEAPDPAHVGRQVGRQLGLQRKIGRIPARERKRNILREILTRIGQLVLLVKILQQRETRALKIGEGFAHRVAHRAIGRRAVAVVVTGGVDRGHHREQADIDIELIALGRRHERHDAAQENERQQDLRKPVMSHAEIAGRRAARMN
jgi:hypothetical protein